MERRLTGNRCLGWLCADNFTRFIRDGLPRGNGGYDAILMLQFAAFEGAGRSIHLVKVCDFTNVEFNVLLHGASCSSLGETGDLYRAAIFDPKMDSRGLWSVNRVEFVPEEKLWGIYRKYEIERFFFNLIVFVYC